MLFLSAKLNLTYDLNLTYNLTLTKPNPNSLTKLVNYVQDLGVYVSNDMKWSKHISYVRSKASATAYQILHSFSSKNVWTLLKAYVTYVWPLLEYNTPVWSPYLQKNIHAIESVQKRYTKTICM